MRSSDKLSTAFRAIKHRKIKGLANLAKYAASLLFKPIKVGHEPLFLHLEPTVECNLRCPFCINDRVQRRQKRMSWQQYQTTIDKFRFLSRVVLTGAGEPLLHPDIVAMIGYAKKRGILTTLTTNATVLSSGLGQDLIAGGLDSIDFSVDAATPETYRLLRRADQGRVLANIRAFMELKKKANVPLRSAINFLVQEKNIAELPLLPEMAASLGVDEIKIMPLHHWGQDLAPKKSAEFQAIAGEKLKTLMPAIKKEAKKRKVRISFLSPCVSAAGRCLWPWRSCYITCDGYVTYCCLLAADPRKYSYGRIFTSSVQDIWNGEKIALLRKQIKRDKACSHI
jgi:MoaA/NifB/PqqE/SkfB family radical SAM enzyme